MQQDPVLIAQLTDLHVGGRGLNAPDADANLRWALGELAAVSPAPACVLVTADLVCAGTREELKQCADLLESCPVPWYALPANHDLWGEQDLRAWEELIGPRRRSVDLDGLRVVLWDDLKRRPDGTWWAHADEDCLEWLDGELAAAPAECIVAQHVPILPVGEEFHDQWRGSNAPDVLDLFRRRRVTTVVTGHWHRNGEWTAGGVHVINTGALAGWNWTGTPPHYCFPTRPGYRLLWYDGNLRSFWREGSYWNMPAPLHQVSLDWIGPSHTGGPRPQVHPVELSGPCRLRACAYSHGGQVHAVEWSVTQGVWEPMELTFRGPWTEWEAELDPADVRAAGELVLCVRSRLDGQVRAVDQVPVRFGQRDSSAKTSAASHPMSERLFELFYCPE